MHSTENLQSTTAFPDFVTTVRVGERVTLACNRSQGIQNPVKWHIYTKEIGQIPVNQMFPQKGLSHLTYEEGNDGMRYTLTLSNFNSSFGDYFVVCSVQSDSGCYIIYPIQPYIITVLDTATTTSATTDGCATTADATTVETTSATAIAATDDDKPVVSTGTDANTDQTTAGTATTDAANADVLRIVTETLDNITLNLATLDDVSSRLDSMSWYLVVVTSLLLLMNSALLLIAVSLCCRRSIDKSSPPPPSLPLGVTNRYATEKGLTTSITL